MSTDLIYRAGDTLDSYDKMQAIAALLVQSQYSGQVKHPADALWLIATGASLGLSPVQSIRGIHVVKGKPVLSADMMAAVALRHPACRYLQVAEMSAERCVIITHREGHPKASEFVWTIDDAKRAGLTGGENWRKYPSAMLKARCMAAAVRATYPDALLGVYADGELDPDEQLRGAEDGAIEQPRILPTQTIRPMSDEAPPHDEDGVIIEGEYEELEQVSQEHGDHDRQRRRFFALTGETDLSKEEVEEYRDLIKKHYRIKSFSQLSVDDLRKCCDRLQAVDPDQRGEWVRDRLAKARQAA